MSEPAAEDVERIAKLIIATADGLDDLSPAELRQGKSDPDFIRDAAKVACAFLTAYQRGRREGREEAAKAIEVIYDQFGSDRAMHYEEAVDIIRSIPLHPAPGGKT